MESMFAGRVRGTRSTASVLLMLFVLAALTLSAVTRFVDFSNSPLTWTHPGPTQGKRTSYNPNAIIPVAPIVRSVIIPSQVLAVEQPLHLEPFQNNLHKRPPPTA